HPVKNVEFRQNPARSTTANTSCQASQASRNTFRDSPETMSFTFSLYASICGASRCLRRASRLSHFSIIVTTFSSKICGGSLASISTAGKYSIHPFSSLTFGILALKISRKSERLSVFTRIEAITLIIIFILLLCSRNIQNGNPDENHLYKLY